MTLFFFFNVFRQWMNIVIYARLIPCLPCVYETHVCTSYISIEPWCGAVPECFSFFFFFFTYSKVSCLFICFPKLYLRCHCLMFYKATNSARVPRWVSGQVTWPSQESHDSASLSEVMRWGLAGEQEKKTENTKQHLPANCSNTQLAADALIRHANEPVWSTRNDTVSAFLSSSYLTWELHHFAYELISSSSSSFSARLNKLYDINFPDRRKGLSGGIPYFIEPVLKFCHISHFLDTQKNTFRDIFETWNLIPEHR